MSLTGGGTDSGCCRVFGPAADDCAQSSIAVVDPEVTIDPVDFLPLGSCGAGGGGSFVGEHGFESCDGSVDVQPYDEQLSFRGLAVTSDNLCPQFVVPGDGAIVSAQPRSDGGVDPRVTIWGGSRCSGPIVMARMFRTLELQPGGRSSIQIFAVAGAGGGSAFIATMTPPCPGWPVVNGCVAFPSSCIDLPLKVGGGGSSSGSFSCDDGELDLSGSLSANYLSACDWELDEFGSCSQSDPPCIGYRPVSTGPFDISFSFEVGVNILDLLDHCGPSPDAGRDTGAAEDMDEPIGRQLLVPEELLSWNTELRAAHDAIRDWLDPGQSQTPPPGTSPQTDPRVSQILDLQSRGGGCRGCGEGFAG